MSHLTPPSRIGIIIGRRLPADRLPRVCLLISASSSSSLSLSCSSLSTSLSINHQFHSSRHRHRHHHRQRQVVAPFWLTEVCGCCVRLSIAQRRWGSCATYLQPPYLLIIVPSSSSNYRQLLDCIVVHHGWSTRYAAASSFERYSLLTAIVVVTLSPVYAPDSLPFRSLTFASNNDTAPLGRASKSESKNLVPAHDNAWFDSRVMSRDHAVLSVSLETQVSWANLCVCGCAS